MSGMSSVGPRRLGEGDCRLLLFEERGEEKIIIPTEISLEVCVGCVVFLPRKGT